MDDIAETLRHPAALVGPCILLLLAERPDHGYALANRLKEFGFAESSTASLYRELRRLEDVGLTHSYWEASQTRGPSGVRAHCCRPASARRLRRRGDRSHPPARELPRPLPGCRAPSPPAPYLGCAPPVACMPGLLTSGPSGATLPIL
jgi:hypothetical protein